MKIVECEEKIVYLKKFKYALLLAKNSGQKYSVGEIKDFLSLNIFPPTPLYQSEKSNYLHFKNKIHRF